MKIKIKNKDFINKDYERCFISYPFRIFYNIRVSEKTPSNLAYNYNENIPDYIIDVFKHFLQAYEIFIKKLHLKNPLKEGIYFDKGAKFIDILIINIPIQKGLVASKLIDNSHYFEEKSLKGKSIKIQLHNGLIQSTATPIHELFHVFQYNYCNFNNMWFMEGLARWSQNLIHNRKMIEERLPQNIEELKYLLSRAHDAEYFFRRLLPKIKDRITFIKCFLEETSTSSIEVENNYNIIWNNDDKKNSRNNKYILKSLLTSINKSTYSFDIELKTFLEIVEEYLHKKNKALEENNIQDFFSILQICDEKLVYKNNNFLYCDHFDLESKELKVKTLNLSSLNLNQLEKLALIKKTSAELIFKNSKIESLNIFNKLKSVHSITISNCKNLSEITGFNSLEYIKNLTIKNNENLKDIFGFFKFFRTKRKLDGFIKIESNKLLKSVSFLRGIEYINSSCYLHNNSLDTLDGLQELNEVNASLSLSGNNLVSLDELKKLNKVNGMLGVAYNKLVSLEGIENLKEISVTKWNDEYRSLALQGNVNLIDISALNCLSNTNHCIIYINSNNKNIIPSKDSDFYKQTIEIVKNKTVIRTKDIFKDYIEPAKQKILFYNTWINVLKNNSYLEAHLLNFNNPTNLILYAKKHGIEYIYGQKYNAQKFLFQNRRILRDNGLKFIVNNLETVMTLLNKKKFYESMENNNLDIYIPTYYKNIDDIKFPCITKEISSSNGENIEIVNSLEELGIKDNYVINEYITGDTEYATNILYKDNILEEITYEKSYTSKKYVLNKDTKYKMIDKKIICPCKEEFTKILKRIIPKGEYLTCCIDYKIKDGIPKIFEINVRFGYTLGRYEKDLFQMMSRYIWECNNG